MEENYDTLDDYVINEKTFELATKGQRFANYLLDFIGYMILALIIGFILGIVMVMIGNEAYFLEEEVTLASKVMDWILGIIIMTIYYVFLEYFMKGKSLGKLVTGTRAVTIDNQRMDLGTTFKRTFCRFIPFEAFSFLGDKATGWHDSLSETKVIVDKGWTDVV